MYFKYLPVPFKIEEGKAGFAGENHPGAAVGHNFDQQQSAQVFAGYIYLRSV